MISAYTDKLQGHQSHSNPLRFKHLPLSGMHSEPGSLPASNDTPDAPKSANGLIAGLNLQLPDQGNPALSSRDCHIPRRASETPSGWCPITLFSLDWEMQVPISGQIRGRNLYPLRSGDRHGGNAGAAAPQFYN